MSEAGKALADVRRWLCDNLSDEDAGRVCGMLSAVSRHINDLEKESDELRALANINAKLLFLVGMCPYIDCSECDAKELCDEAIYLEGIYGIDKDLCGDERNSHEAKGDIRCAVRRLHER